MTRKGTCFKLHSRDKQREQRNEVFDGGRVFYLSDSVMAAILQLHCLLLGLVDIGGSAMFLLSL